MRWQAEVIDTWNMTIEDCGIKQGRFRIELGGKPYMAVRFTRVFPAVQETEPEKPGWQA